LLVAFFKACVPLLSSAIDDSSSDLEEGYQEGRDPERYNTDSDDYGHGDGDDSRVRTVPKTEGRILVTLFEGEPYTLWNIRDLARHAGLRVVTSFRFPWKSYPGYSHARTLGVVESRSGKAGGGWKGEDREARTYVFEVKGDDNKTRPGTAGQKRAREESSDDDD
jgi:25S rRNA (uracil2634-N3)-methyltransferase